VHPARRDDQARPPTPGGPRLARALGAAPHDERVLMNNLLKTLIAGSGAKKLGGGCISTVLIFIVIFWLLGRF
jgi:hypothetical protein